MRLFFVLCFFITTASAAVENFKFLVVSDIHYGASIPLKNGEDTGPESLELALQQFQKHSTEVDFILNLGDLPAHMMLVSSNKEHYEHTVFHSLYGADKSKKPMFYIPGNNDSLSGNYMPFCVHGKSPLSVATEWQGACAFCNGLMIDDSFMSEEGFYSTYVIPGNKNIMLIALNTAPLIHVPLLAGHYPSQRAHALQELNWLKQQMKNHSAKQLLIAMHVPPGVDYKGGAFWHKDYLQRFMKILTQYSAAYGQITLLTGHTHMDELRKMTLPNGIAVYDYSAPSISRNHYNNPGMKVFSLNKDLQIANYTTYYTDVLDEWTNKYYQAMGAQEAIFSQCNNTNSLAVCLNSLSAKQVCDDLNRESFYTVKSFYVPNLICENTYSIS